MPAAADGEAVSTTSSADPARAHLEGRFPCFDGLRAIAALMVVFHHTGFTTAFELRGARIPFTEHTLALGHYTARMDSGVQVFFLISGFLLYRPMVAAAFAGKRPRDVRSYSRHRFLRIYPAYWVAFVIITIFFGIAMPIAGFRSIFEYFFLIHLYDGGHAVVNGTQTFRALGGISQSWTLVVEVSFYIFLPFYAALLRRLGRGRDHESRFRLELFMLGVLYAISVLWRAYVFYGAPKGSAVSFLGTFWLPAQLDVFALGMALAVIRAWAEQREAHTPFLERIGKLDWLWWVVAALLFHAVSYWGGLTQKFVTISGIRAYEKEFFYSFMAFFLVLPAVFGAQHKGVTRRFLQLRPMVYLGTISYGIYLWHQAFLEKVHQWGGWKKPLPSGPFLEHLIPTLVLTIIVASLSWYLVERPLLRIKDRPLFGRGRSSRASRAPAQ
jgi:peptidoglycan/LPS O-acetylase OafA/YrhL